MQQPGFLTPWLTSPTKAALKTTRWPDASSVPGDRDLGGVGEGNGISDDEQIAQPWCGGEENGCMRLTSFNRCENVD